MTEWTELHPDFTPELQKEWESREISYHEAKQWIKGGLSPHDYEIAAWLQWPKGKVRNILLIGRTGSGKSTLANVLINKNNNFEEVFKESKLSFSETQTTLIEEVEIEGIKCRIIDTVGTGDVHSSQEEILNELNRLEKASNYLKDGLNQILFVMNGRFTGEEIESFNLLKRVIFNDEIVKYTTIVRTNFAEFEDAKVCEQDRQRLKEANNPKIAEIIRACNKVIYVDNPPMPIINESDSEYAKRRKLRHRMINMETRKESRAILLNHLANHCFGYWTENEKEFQENKLKSEIVRLIWKSSKEKANLTKSLAKTQAQLAQEQQQSKGLTEEKERLQTDLKLSQLHIQAHIAFADQLTESKEQQLKEQQSFTAAIKQKLEAEQAAHQQTKLVLVTARNEFAKVQQERQNLVATQLSLQEQLAQTQQTTTSLQQRIEKLQSELNNAENHYQTIATALEQQKKQLVTTSWTDPDLQAAAARIKALETELTKTQQELTNKKQYILTLQKQLVEVEENKELEKQQALSSLTIEKRKLELDLTNLKEQLQDQQQELKKIKDQQKHSLYYQKTSGAQLRNQKKEIVKAVNHLQKQVTNKEREITVVINHINHQCISEVQGSIEIGGHFNPQASEYQSQVEQPAK